MRNKLTHCIPLYFYFTNGLTHVKRLQYKEQVTDGAETDGSASQRQPVRETGRKTPVSGYQQMIDGVGHLQCVVSICVAEEVFCKKRVVFLYS